MSSAASFPRPIRYAVEQRQLAWRDALQGNLRGLRSKRVMMRFYALTARFYAGQLAATDPRLSEHRARLAGPFRRYRTFSQP